MVALNYPAVIQCAELAATRESARVRERMKGRLTDLASIAATAPLLGFLGTVFGIAHSFQSFGSSKSTILAGDTLRISAAMAPGAFGLIVALFAYWSYRYLSLQLETFEREMHGARLQLVNEQFLYLHSLRQSNPELWSTLTRLPDRRAAPCSELAEFEAPRLSLSRIYRNGILELVWPRQDSDHESIVNVGVWLCLAYAVALYLVYCLQNRSLTGLVLFTFFVAGAVGLRARCSKSPVYVAAFFLAAAIFTSLSPFGPGAGVLLLIIAALPMIGVAKAIRAQAPVRSSRFAPALERALLPLLFVCACSAVLFGTF